KTPLPVSLRRRQPSAPGADGNRARGATPGAEPLCRYRGSVHYWQVGRLDSKAGRRQTTSTASARRTSGRGEGGLVATRLAGHSYIIKRPRLTKLLDESQARIILLCAPAGYGKTTLAREWIATRSEPVAWYQGGPEMLDVAAVAQSLARALLGVGIAAATPERVTALAARGANARALARALSAGLPKERPAWVVLDDYHRAAGTESETLFDELITDSRLRVVVTSRIKPTWVSARMTVYGEAVVVGLESLAFTDEEARQVLAEGGMGALDDLVSQARGWPAVIGLAAGRQPDAAKPNGALLPEELYDFIADDLMRTTSTALQESLFLLALGADRSERATLDLLGPSAEAVLADAAARGLLTSQGRRFEMHPLV